MMISVEELLQAPVMRGSRLMAGHEVAGQRGFTWTSVIEWQQVRFVNPDELVFTTGIGLDEVMLLTFLQELLESPATVLCVSLNPTGAAREIPAAALEEADRRGIPVVDVPWEIGFADVNHWAADELLRKRKATALEGSVQNGFPGFTDVLLDRGSVSDVAAALETAITRPVLVFDASMLLTGHGPIAEREMTPGAITNLRLRTATLSVEEAETLAEQLHRPNHHHSAGQPLIGLPSGLVVAAVARRRLMGFVYVPDLASGEGRYPSDADLVAIREAANVIAIAGMRGRSATPADKLDREDFLWDVVHGDLGPPESVIRRATELGFDPRTRFALALGCIDPASKAQGAASLQSQATDIRRRCSRRRLDVFLCSRDDTLLILVSSGIAVLRETLEQAAAEAADDSRLRWGLARGVGSLAELGGLFRDARAALRIGEALKIQGNVADAAELEPFLLLGGIARDPQGAALARSVVQPLIDYDRKSGRNLLETVETYLATGGNASSTARQLNLNRHSMHYRLDKLAELTGRDLGDAADRFVVDLSIKLYRLGALSAQAQDS
jgi:purine catabolism regulator